MKNTIIKALKQRTSMRNLAMLAVMTCVVVAFLPSMAWAVEWNGGAGNGSMSDGDNWVGGNAPAAGDTLDFSSIASATTLNADFGDGRTFGAVTMGSGVITFTGSLTSTSFSDYSKVAVGANATVTIDNDLSFTSANPKLCNNVLAGGKLRITGVLTIAHSSGDFSFAANDAIGAVVAEGGIVVNTANWVVMNVASLVLGANGISFDKGSVFHFTTTSTIYSLGAETALGSYGVGSYCSKNLLTICTTQFESDQPATITFAGYYKGKSYYWGAATVTGCGKVVFTSTSISNRGLTANDGTTLSMAPGVDATQAGGQTFAIKSGATFDVSGAGTVSFNANASFEAGSTFNIAAYSAGAVALSVGQNLTLPSSGTVNLTLNGGAFTPGVYVILEKSGVTAAMGDKFNVSTGDEPASWSVVGSRLVLTVGTVPANLWTGAAGDGSMANGNNWAGGSAPVAGGTADFSNVTVATTINADMDESLGAVTMGDGVITFTGSLTSTSFSDYSKVAVGANATVTIDNDLSFTSANPKLCNNVLAGGKLRITGVLTIAHSSGDFSFAANDAIGAVVAEGGIVVNTANWVVMNVASLVLGANGISFDKGSVFHFTTTSTIYSLGAETALGSYGVGSYCSKNLLTICTTQFESDQPATITFAGYYKGKSYYWGAATVTGCGKVVFTSTSTSNRGLTTSDGATIAMTPGCDTLVADDQTFTINSGSTLEIPSSGTTTLGFETTAIKSGATLAFNFSHRKITPILAVASGKSSSLPDTVNVKVSAADGIRPRSGSHTLTSGMNFTGKTVNLVTGPKWADGVSVDEGGNLVLAVKPMGTVLVVK